MVTTTIKIDRNAMRRDIEAMIDKRLALAGDRIGGVVKSQAQARFANSGDEDGAWPDLWANDDSRVRRMVEPQLEEAGREKLAREVRNAQKAYDKAFAATDSAKMLKASGRLDRAKAALDGNPSYRRGGKPLVDTGAGQASITYRVLPPAGGSVLIEIGSPLQYLQYQQEGFKTQGPNFIPLSLKAKKHQTGANPRDEGLIPGVDYVIAWGGVTVPARPIVRFTKANLAELAGTLARIG